MPSIALGIQPRSWLMPDRQANKNMGNFRERKAQKREKKFLRNIICMKLKLVALAKMRACLLFDGGWVRFAPSHHTSYVKNSLTTALYDT